MTPRMRTIEQAAAEIKALDPETAISKTALRRLVLTGVISCVKVGNKRLVNLDSVFSYLGMSGSERETTAVPLGGIVPIKE